MLCLSRLLSKVLHSTIRNRKALRILVSRGLIRGKLTFRDHSRNKISNTNAEIGTVRLSYPLRLISSTAETIIAKDALIKNDLLNGIRKITANIVIAIKKQLTAKQIDPARVFCPLKKDLENTPHRLPPHSAAVSEMVRMDIGRKNRRYLGSAEKL